MEKFTVDVMIHAQNLKKEANLTCKTDLDTLPSGIFHNFMQN